MLESVRDYERTVVRACHAPGKTFTAASAALWSTYAFPGSLVITSAPTWRQIEDLLWGDLRKLYNNACVNLGGELLPRAPRLELADGWRCFGVSTRTKEQMQGYHSYRILIILDEDPGINEQIHEAIRGIQAGGDVRLLRLGNPTKSFGSFYEAFHSARGLYNCITLSCWDTINLAHLKPAYDACKTLEEKLALLRSAPVKNPNLIKAKWVADMLEEFGEDSDIFRVRCLGDFPRGGNNNLIPIHLVEEAAHRWMEMFHPPEGKKAQLKWWIDRSQFYGQPVGALDPARFGRAESALCSRLDEVVAPLDCWSGLSVPLLVGNTVARHKELDLRALVVDETGLGGGPLDDLRLELPNVDGFLGGSSANNSERFFNLNAESFWGLRERFYQGRIHIPYDPKLMGQISSILYGHKPDGRIFVETKEDAEKRGLKFRDRADSLMMACARQAVIDYPARVVGTGTDWSKMHHGR